METNKKTTSNVVKIITSIVYFILTILITFGNSFSWHNTVLNEVENFWEMILDELFWIDYDDDVLLGLCVVFTFTVMLIGIISVWIKNLNLVSIIQSAFIFSMLINAIIGASDSNDYGQPLFLFIIFLCIILIILNIVLITLNKQLKDITSGDEQMNEQNGYIDMAKHILLLLFTCGIWYYIWLYRTTKTLNNTPNEEYYDPTSKLLLCMFVPFYYIYWVAKHAQRLDKYANSNGVQSDIYTICLIMSIFVPIVSYIIMQDKINAVAKKLCGYEEPTYQYANAPANTFPKYNDSYSQNNSQTINKSKVNPLNEMDKVELLKQYKELLDEGIISQEDFDAKKKELLNL